MTCTVRFWAGARALAGVTECTVPDGPLADVLAEIAARYGTQLESLVLRSVLVVDDERIEPSPDSYLRAGSVLEILPPYAGG